MPKRFRVTGLGLKIDRTMIMPGSDLLLNADPPSHWQRFGESLGSVADRKLEVATPARELPETPEPPPSRDVTGKRRGRPKKVDEGSDEG